MEIQRTRQLAMGLIISGTLNVGLLLALFFVWKGGSTPILSLEQIEAQADSIEGPGKAALLLELSNLPYEQLLTQLGDASHVEDGFTRRDLVLGALVSRHHFNISKALAGTTLQPRQFTLSGEKIVLFPGLSDEQFKRVSDYASHEAWPLTSQGLFIKLKEKKEPSLKAAFCLSLEYGQIDTLMKACGLDVSKEQIVQMLTDGQWKELQDFSKDNTGELSVARLQKLLWTYVENCSSVAAEILVQSYPEYALKKLDDPSVILLLRQLKSATPAAKSFAKELLLSPRSRAVWQAAAARLYQFHGEPMPKSFDYRAAVARFATPALLQKKLVSAAKPPLPIKKEEPLKKETAKKEASSKKKSDKQFLHVVRQGESLWTIAKQYHVEGDVIKKANSLKNDKIREGQVLIIP